MTIHIPMRVHDTIQILIKSTIQCVKNKEKKPAFPPTTHNRKNVKLKLKANTWQNTSCENAE